MTPDHLRGKEFEAEILRAGQRFESERLLTIGKYGVQVMGGFPGGEMRPIQSLPDFEGVLSPSGRQFIIEAKVVSGPSFTLENSHFGDRQLRHLLRRSEFGASCWLLMHWNARELKTRADQAATIAIPVTRSARWEAIASGEIKSISRESSFEIGVPVPWIVPPRCRKAIPDLRAFLFGR